MWTREDFLAVFGGEAGHYRVYLEVATGSVSETLERIGLREGVKNACN
jgi:hypothetical protein